MRGIANERTRVRSQARHGGWKLGANNISVLMRAHFFVLIFSLGPNKMHRNANGTRSHLSFTHLIAMPLWVHCFYMKNGHLIFSNLIGFTVLKPHLTKLIISGFLEICILLNSSVGQ